MKLSISFRNLLKQLALFNGMVYHFDSLISTYSLAYKNHPRLKANKFILGSKLVYRHPITLKQVWAKNTYEVNEKNLKSSLLNFKRYNANYFACQSYEAFETYLYNRAAKTAMLRPKNVQNIKKLIKCKSQKDYLKQLKKEYKSCHEIYSQVILKLLPELDNDIKMKFPDYSKFFNFLRVYSLARNCITHADSQVKFDEMKNVTIYELDVLKEFFGVTVSKTRSFSPLNTSKEIRKLIGTLGQLASLIENYSY